MIKVYDYIFTEWKMFVKYINIVCHSLILSGEHLHGNESEYVATYVHAYQCDGRFGECLWGIEIA